VRAIVGASSLTEQIMASVREAIRVGELRPGELYSVYQLAELLKVSRTPAREALVRLAESGLVRFERNRGFRVRRRDPAEIAEIFHLRLLLEVPAAARAAELAGIALVDAVLAELAAMRAAATAGDEPEFMAHDRALHDLVLAAGGNRLLTGYVGGLREAVTTLGASTVGTSRSLRDIAAEHEPIVAALAAHDPVAAASAMRKHLTHTGELLLDQAARELGGPPPAECLALIRSAQN
jgi:DNA-binding GntR family transcriptional regulator